MKTCPNCHNQVKENAVYCPVCGTGIDAAPQFQQQRATEYAPEYQAPVKAEPVPCIDPFDHTQEFSADDISASKAAVMLMYLLGPVGIIIALLCSNNSRYTAFHVQQAIKLTVAEILGILMSVVVCFFLWNIHLRFLAVFVIAVVLIGLVGIHLACFFQICNGKAKEVFLIRNLKFLK